MKKNNKKKKRTMADRDQVGSDSRNGASEDARAEAGAFAYEGLDRVLHEKARLGILTALRTRADGLLFGELKDLCSLTDGNLSRHLSVLQEAGLVEIVKAFRGAKPQTWAVLTKSGRDQFDAYLGELQRVIEDANVRVAPAENREPPGAPA